MKKNIILTVFVLLTAPGFASAATNDVARLVERGLFEEEANHQLDAAIGDYKEAIAHFDHERQLAATAIFRLGECYRKLGRTNEANAQYERIAREFPDQTQFAQLSQGYLPAGASGTVAAGSMAMPTEEAEFLRKAIATFQTSPDLMNQQLSSAAKAGYVSAAEFLLAHGADVKQGILVGEAARQGNEAMVRLLLAHGADVNSLDGEASSRTPLRLAVEMSFKGVCLTLISNGADVNLQSPLAIAAGLGKEAMVELLLSHGAAINQPDINGITALSRAVKEGFMPLCQFLVSHGADVNTKDKNGSTPLHLAIEKGNIAAAEFLITNKAAMNGTNNNGETPLLLALSQNNTNMVKLLLDNHADVNMEASVGTTWRLSPLAWAIYTDSPDLVSLLLEEHADPNAVVASHPDPVPNLYYTLGRLHGAGHSAAPWELGWAQPVAGQTPLLWATSGNPPHAAEIIQLLLDHGAKPNLVDAAGEMALASAVVRNMIDVVRELIAHGADVNALDKEGLPPLAHLRSPRTETGSKIEELLIKAGADADYNRRRAIWVCGVGGAPKAEIFQCPANSINHYTLLEFLAALYDTNPSHRYSRIPMPMPQSGFSQYSHRDDVIPFPDFARVAVLRLDGKSNEVLHVNVADILQAGGGSKDIALQAGDMVDIAQLEHRVSEQWYALPPEVVMAMNKCLLRAVQLVAQGKTNLIALIPYIQPMRQSLPSLVRQGPYYPGQVFDTSDSKPNWMTEALHGRKASAVVQSFLLDSVVRHPDVLLNTWDLSRVRLTRGDKKMTFDLTVNPAPNVWLENGDVIEISEVGEGTAH